MKENKIKVRDLVNKYQENCDRISEIAEACEKGKRERNEAETAEYETLIRENQLLSMKMQAAAASASMSERRGMITELRESLREAMDNGSKNPVVLVAQRESNIQTTAALTGTGIIPVQEQEMLKPLRAGLIWDKVGINIRFGLTGTLRWPKHGKATAKFVGEAEALTVQQIDWDKIEVAPKRLGAAVEVTSQELFQSEGVVEGVINEEIPQAIIDKVNDALFCTDTTGRMVYGPFAKAGQSGGCAKKTLGTTVPTRKDLLTAKALVAKAGIDTSGCCWVMSELMKAELEATPIDAGSGRFLCENDKVLGYPVFTTDVIGDNNIGFGDWSYQAAGFFGQWRYLVDPYSLALNDATRFVLNTDFATVTLRPEAFILLSCAEE